MGKQQKKHSKGRLDRYYYLAKEKGYRARSSFKIIQINEKYGSVPGFAGKHFHPSYSAWQCNPFLHKQECNLCVQLTMHIVTRTCSTRCCRDSQRLASEEHPWAQGKREESMVLLDPLKST